MAIVIINVLYIYTGTARVFLTFQIDHVLISLRHWHEKMCKDEFDNQRIYMPLLIFSLPSYLSIPIWSLWRQRKVKRFTYALTEGGSVKNMQGGGNKKMELGEATSVTPTLDTTDWLIEKDFSISTLQTDCFRGSIFPAPTLLTGWLIRISHFLLTGWFQMVFLFFSSLVTIL